MTTSRAHASVADVMTANVIHCVPETPLRDVARLMTSHAIHAVYVLDPRLDGNPADLWGLVSDLDVAAAWPVIDERTAGNSAVTPLVTVASDEPIGRAAQLMAESDCAHLAVIDRRTQQPVGVVSSLDIARAVAD
jgi:CBS domain-containing protein